MSRCTILVVPSLETTLSRLLADDYLDGMKERSLEEVRNMRSECQDAETAVSYLRRMAQGRLDIVHAYLDHLEDGSMSDLPSLVEHLPTIMAGPPRPAGPGRLPSQMAPDFEAESTRAVDDILDAERIAQLPTMDRARLLELAEQLSAVESRTSHERRALHERIDKLQAEIVSRYKSGEATVEGLLA